MHDDLSCYEPEVRRELLAIRQRLANPSPTPSKPPARNFGYMGSRLGTEQIAR